MKFPSLNDPRDFLDAHAIIDDCQNKGIGVEVKPIKQQRTLSQNNYYHLILRYYASQIGLSETEAEREFKFDCEANREKFVTEVIDKKGNTHLSIRSSADLSKEEMTSAIHNFIDYAAIYAGIILPYETDYGHIREARQEIKKVKSYI